MLREEHVGFFYSLLKIHLASTDIKAIANNSDMPNLFKSNACILYNKHNVVGAVHWFQKKKKKRRISLRKLRYVWSFWNKN